MTEFNNVWKILPKKLESIEFDEAALGYNPEQVDRVLDEVIDVMKQMLSECSKIKEEGIELQLKNDELTKENANLNLKLTTLQSKLDDISQNGYHLFQQKNKISQLNTNIDNEPTE